jgi:hypothetical protein
LRADAGFAAGFAAGFDAGDFGLADVPVERCEARFGVGFGFGSVMAAPPRDAVDQ